MIKQVNHVGPPRGLGTIEYKMVAVSTLADVTHRSIVLENHKSTVPKLANTKTAGT